MSKLLLPTAIVSSNTRPPNTSSGTKLRVKGHGVHPKDGTAGDLLAEIQIVLPKSLDDEFRQMIEKSAAEHPEENPRAKLRW